MRGHYAYYGITGNSRCVARFRWAVSVDGGSGLTAATANADDLGAIQRLAAAISAPAAADRLTQCIVK